MSIQQEISKKIKSMFNELADFQTKEVRDAMNTLADNNGETTEIPQAAYDVFRKMNLGAAVTLEYKSTPIHDPDQHLADLEHTEEYKARVNFADSSLAPVLEQKIKDAQNQRAAEVKDDFETAIINAKATLTQVAEDIKKAANNYEHDGFYTEDMAVIRREILNRFGEALDFEMGRTDPSVSEVRIPDNIKGVRDAGFLEQYIARKEREEARQGGLGA